jgi:hypothetical protein
MGIDAAQPGGDDHAMTHADDADPAAARGQAFADLLLDSYRRVVGRPLLDIAAGERPTAQFLYDATSFSLLAHDGAADPIFIYANRTAQSCFGYDWDTFTRLPSRLSAEAPDRAERQRLLQTVARDGFIDNYHGIRIAGSGRRFWIERAVVWELLDNTGTRHGQAAIFRDWRPID